MKGRRRVRVGRRRGGTESAVSAGSDTNIEQPVEVRTSAGQIIVAGVPVAGPDSTR
jgi:hypothetical protein